MWIGAVQVLLLLGGKGNRWDARPPCGDDGEVPPKQLKGSKPNIVIVLAVDVGEIYNMSLSAYPEIVAELTAIKVSYEKEADMF
eukprot:gene5871-32052_t